MWRVSWQDYRHWRTADLKQPHPKITKEDFADRSAADSRKEQLVRDGMTVCITPTPFGKRTRRTVLLPGDKTVNAFAKGWKLHT